VLVAGSPNPPYFRLLPRYNPEWKLVAFIFVASPAPPCNLITLPVPKCSFSCGEKLPTPTFPDVLTIMCEAPPCCNLNSPLFALTKAFVPSCNNLN